MRYSFTYIDTLTGVQNTETTNARGWASFWDDDRNGLIEITHVEVSVDNWETSFTAFDKSLM